jgi:hypothetical protein
VALAASDVADIQRYERGRRAALTGAGVIVAVLLGLVAGATGKTQDAVAVALVVALPIVWWRAPAIGVITLLGCSAVIEQFGYTIYGKPGLDAFTDKIPFFASLQGGFNLSGLVFSPADLSVVLLLLVWITRGVTQHTLRLPRSQVAAMMGLMVLLAVIALLRGIGLGGNDARAALWEIRPWVYMGATYLFASQFLTTRRACRAALWTFVIGSGFKALQGVYIWVETRGISPAPQAILAHEESFFFGLFVILTAALWIFRQRGALRITATALLPLVLLADLGNSRRDAILILGAGVVVLLVLAYAALPERRPMLRRIVAVTLLASAVYLPLEWNSTSTLAEPARAVQSVIAPDARDQASNQYRLEEDANIGDNIKNGNPILGTGFGTPIDYGYVPIVNIQAVDSFILWVPHNGVLYVWMRMGLIGEVALWLFVAAGVMAGARASRSADREVALLGAVVGAALVGWVAMGYTDMGFFWFRIAIAMGGLLGLLHAMVSVEQSASETEAATARHRAPARAPVPAVVVAAVDTRSR